MSNDGPSIHSTLKGLPAPTFRFPKSRKLLTGKQFDTVFSARTSVGDGVLVMHVRPNDRGEARLGMAVSKKVGNAVRRNRWKRLLREAFRLAQHELPPLDMVCLPRFRGEPSLPAIRASLLDLARRAERKAAKKQAAKAEKTVGQEEAAPTTTQKKAPKKDRS